MHIQVMKTFKASFSNVWRHLLEWFRVAFAPLCILIFGLLFMVFAYWYSGMAFQIQEVMMGNTLKVTEVTVSNPLMHLAHSVYFITYFIFIFSIYINNVRYAVLHEGGTKWWTLHLNWRFVKMILYMLLISVLGGLYVSLAAGIVIGAHYLFASIPVDIILGTAFFVYGSYIAIRISLYNVLIALDKPHPLRTSWALLKGNILRLLGLSVLLVFGLLGLTLVGLIVLGIVGILFDLIYPGASAVLLGAFMCFMFQFIFLAVSIKMISLVYQTLSGDKVSKAKKIKK